MGQALGTPQRIQELTKPQDIQEKHIPLHIKPVPPAQPPPKFHARLSSRALQQGQPNGHPIKVNPPTTDSLEGSQERGSIGHPLLAARSNQAPPPVSNKEFMTAEAKEKVTQSNCILTVPLPLLGPVLRVYVKYKNYKQ